VTETEVISGLKIVTTEVKIKSPVFEDFPVKVPVFQDIEVKVPVFVEKQIEVPIGLDKVVNDLALSIAEKVFTKIETILNDKLSKAIDERISQIKYPKLIEELEITKIPVTVDVPVFKDKEVLNPVLKDVEIINAVIIDKPVLNAVIDDIRVNNAIIKDIEVERAVVREKVIEVIHKTCLDAKGNRLEE